MTPTEAPAPLLLGPYELVEHVASGGMAEVYVARRAGPHGFQKIVAVKRILPQLVTDDEFVGMFVNEARVAATLSHPNIVQVFDFGEQNGELYMAMEYVRGTNVARITRRAAALSTPVPLDVCLYIALSVLRGLEYAHSAKDENGELLKLVHRDVSPGNVLLDDSGAVKLTDFGIARAATIERRTMVGHLKGKLGYMSPEQVMGLELDARSDLFTLGIVLAELLTLRPLFAAPTEIEILTRIRDADVRSLREAALPPEVLTVLRRALTRTPELRYESARAFADDIESLARRRGLSLGAPRLAAFMASLVGRRSTHPAGVHEADTVNLPAPDEDGQRQSGEGASPSASGNEHGSAARAWEDERQTPMVANYHVEYPDRTLSGPHFYHQLAELFATGALGPGCRVSRDGGPFADAHVFPELQRFVTSSTVAWDSDGRWSMRPRQPIDRATLPGWLFRLAVGRKTGAILLRDGGRKKKVFLVEGVPEFASSTDKRELLGEHLIASAGVLRVEVEMALSMLPRFGGRLGDALVGLGVLRPVELVRAIHQQTITRYLELFRWKTGEVAFDPGASSGEETFPLGVDAFDLVGRGVRESYPSDELEGWLETFGDALLSPASSPLLRRDALRWTDPEARVLVALDGPSPLAAFLREQRLRPDVGPEAVYAIFLGLSYGILALPGFVVPEID